MDKNFKFTNAVIGLPLFFVLFLWFVYWLEIRFDFDFVENGIYPRTFSGLQGIIFSPFIHSGLNHLYNNSIPLLVLLAALQFFYSKLSFKVIVYGILFSGGLTWLIGRENYHVGASGLIYVLFAFIFFKGIFIKYYRLVALSLAVIIMYGGMIWYVFPRVDDTISWEGHLAGLITGFVLAILYQTPEFRKVPKYDWEMPDYDPSQDKFMQRFDENGNFVNPPIIDVEEEIQSYCSSNVDVNYDIIENEKNESKPES
ncbi:Membrane associated serine protease, rhomboid family [Flavobacterium glycines]|uniref:Membrane associated serine protease, rhomboid family n=1 Tax=Flavobacterium glycines TaxID=551990 RepID=A0A1B9DHQ5_9FLAO|nr:rhomboid family intramembrane serine protease [Flavobacterium glycines]OCB69203.1 rhomboid family intramembrane serine protease [Flavobacterium glycines]GEL11928.1 rhomboid family intramembrane serine protease [Flavobacterium glycines]SDJ56476.1 Membrane associated serine protease, rhomboid family [Flavobacterium glycines]